MYTIRQERADVKVFRASHRTRWVPAADQGAGSAGKGSADGPYKPLLGQGFAYATELKAKNPIAQDNLPTRESIWERQERDHRHRKKGVAYAFRK